MRQVKKALALLVLLGAGSGCATALRGGDADLCVHLPLTYSMARAAGFDADDSLRIAGANVFTDEHPETSSVATERRLLGGIANPLVLPAVLFSAFIDVSSGRENPVRALGANTAQYTAWTLPPLALKLHFPAGTLHQPTEPAFSRDPQSGLVYLNNRHAVVLLEQAFRAIECRDEDTGRTLALLGVALHVLQDSYKHASYNGARGHIGVRPTPDDVSGDPRLALEIAETTYLSLRHARLRMLGRRTPPAADWQKVVAAVYDPSAKEASCGADRWLRVIRETFGEDLGSWADVQSRWAKTGGEEDFERALEKIRRVIR